MKRFLVCFYMLAGCGLAPDVGPLATGGCDNADTDPKLGLGFAADIQPILKRCGCHMPTSAGAPGPATQITGLDLSSLATLRAGGHNSGPDIVIAMQPCDSILYQKVGVAPPFGARMPYNGPPYLTDDEIRKIHDWIAEGGQP